MIMINTHANEGHLENIARSKSRLVDYWYSLSSSKEKLLSTSAHSTDHGRSAVSDFAALRSCGGNTNLRDGSLLMVIMLPSVSNGLRLGRKGVFFFLITEHSFLGSIWMRHCKDQFNYSGTLAGHRDVGSTLHTCLSLQPRLNSDSSIKR